MKKVFLVLGFLMSFAIIAQDNNLPNKQNNENKEHLSQINDDLRTNTYNLDMNEGDLEPASLTNILQHHDLGDTSWKDPKRDLQGNIVYDDVLYEHGEGGQAQMKAKNNMMSSVCGHTHTEAYVKWFVGKRFRVFGMQTACGIDIKSYATAYAKNFKRQALGVGVVLGGHTAFNCMMDL